MWLLQNWLKIHIVLNPFAVLSEEFASFHNKLTFILLYLDYGVSSLDQWPLASFRDLYVIGRFLNVWMPHLMSGPSKTVSFVSQYTVSLFLRKHWGSRETKTINYFWRGQT